MPAKTDKQRRFMAAVANNPAFAKKVGVPQSVGREFTAYGGGQVKPGYHKMPDGKIMKDSAHKMMGGGKVMKYEHGGSVSCRGNGMARKKRTQMR